MNEQERAVFEALLDEHERVVETERRRREIRREKLAWALARPLAMTGFAVLLTVVEPFVLWFIAIESLVWLAAAVDWWQFAVDRLRPGWRKRHDG